MHRRSLCRAASIAFLVCFACDAAEPPCPAHLAGVITDPSGAAIAGAAVAVRGSRPEIAAKTDSQGRFTLACVPAGSFGATIQANGFEPAERRVKLTPGRSGVMNVRMEIAIQRTVVEASDKETKDPREASPAVLLTRRQLDGLADDPTDMRHQLQAIAAATAGGQGAATILVDGFTTGGLPPKSAIGEVRINADMFSAEYQNPPFQGGQIEIATKAAGAGIHGLLAASDDASPLNARDSLAPARAATGRRLYQGSIALPVIANRLDVMADFEKRTIDEFKVVQAVTLDGLGSGFVPLNANVAAPQQYENGSLRSHWQIDRKNSAVFAYSLTRDRELNQGTGGLVLPESAYSSSDQQQSVRVSATSVISAKVLNEARASYSWNALSQLPTSTAPAIVVSGAFIGGGSMDQNTGRTNRSFNFEDSVSAILGKHAWKAGVQFERRALNYLMGSDTNGLFTFAGGVWNGQPLTAIEQYQLVLAGAPGVMPTAYSVTLGDPRTAVTQTRAAFYVQDNWRISQTVSLSLGLRQAIQTAPNATGLWAPRLGIAWTPTKTLVLRLRYGMFIQPIDPGLMADTLHLNGQNGYQALVYQPSFTNPLASLPANVAEIRNVREFAPNVNQPRISQSQAAIEKEFKGQWKLQSQIYWTDTHQMIRSLSFPSLTAPGNQFIYEADGHTAGPTMFVGLSQVAKKRFTFFAGYLLSKVRSDADTPDLFPQSTASRNGEFVQPSWLSTNRIFGFGQVSLPWKVNVTTFLNASSGKPFDVTTGSDINGDGVFNDRPGVVTGPAPDAVATPFGYLTPSGRGAVLPRDIGRMPAVEGLDLSVNRKFALKSAGSSLDSVPTMTLNLKATNALNHTNVSQVDGILNSPLFLRGIAADASRRVEIGLKFEF